MTSLAPLSAIDPFGSTAKAVTSAASAVSTAAQKTLFGGVTLSQAIVILLGLLLIGAGLFSMQKTREIIVQAGKTAAAAAA